MPDTPLDVSVLPDDLRHLLPFVVKYGEPDDEGRAMLLAGASVEELRELSSAAQPHWDAINAFLDLNVEAEPGPQQDMALALDSFSQAAMEADLELGNRS